METYETPRMEITELDAEDVIVTSGDEDKYPGEEYVIGNG